MRGVDEGPPPAPSELRRAVGVRARDEGPPQGSSELRRAVGVREAVAPDGHSGQRAIRRANLSAVARLVAAEGPRSRATIALRTGFNKSTVSSLVAELLELGLLAETGEEEHPGRVGRPARTVSLNAGHVAAAGLEVNVDHLWVCVVDLAGHLLHAERVVAANGAGRPAPVLDELARLAASAIAGAEAQGVRVVGAGVALPGLVDRRDNRLVVAPNLGWREVPVGAELARRLERPGLLLTIDNEANLAALAEHWDGAARDLDDFVCVSGEVGIGGGVVVGGELFRGTHGFGGELGHVVVDPAGARCACGARGCLETVAGQDAVLRAAGVPPAAGAAELLTRAGAGDERAIVALDAAGHALGIALTAVVNVLDPSAVLLGGYLAPFTPWLEGPISAELGRRVLASAWSGCEIRAAGIGQGAAARGAAAGVLRTILADPALIAVASHEALPVRYDSPVGR